MTDLTGDKILEFYQRPRWAQAASEAAIFSKRVYWRLKSLNGQTISTGHHGYRSKWAAEHGAQISLGGQLELDPLTATGVVIARQHDTIQVKYLDGLKPPRKLPTREPYYPRNFRN